MRANHIPVVERLQNRIQKLQHQMDINHVKSPNKGNPYWCCKVCGIHDPELSTTKGKHRHGCNVGGIPKEITYYQMLLDKEQNFVKHIMEG
jgi:hypothetical protein